MLTSCRSVLHDWIQYLKGILVLNWKFSAWAVISLMLGGASPGSPTDEFMAAAGVGDA